MVSRPTRTVCRIGIAKPVRSSRPVSARPRPTTRTGGRRSIRLHSIPRCRTGGHQERDCPRFMPTRHHQNPSPPIVESEPGHLVRTRYFHPLGLNAFYGRRARSSALEFLGNRLEMLPIAFPTLNDHPLPYNSPGIGRLLPVVRAHGFDDVRARRNDHRRRYPSPIVTAIPGAKGVGPAGLEPATKGL